MTDPLVVFVWATLGLVLFAAACAVFCALVLASRADDEAGEP